MENRRGKMDRNARVPDLAPAASVDLSARQAVLPLPLLLLLLLIGALLRAPILPRARGGGGCSGLAAGSYSKEGAW